MQLKIIASFYPKTFEGWMESLGGSLICCPGEASPDDGVVVWRQFLGNRNTISTVKKIFGQGWTRIHTDKERLDGRAVARQGRAPLAWAS
jgi:hypothetical protein